MLTKNLTTVITKQYRPGPEKVIYDPPGGDIESGQTPEEAAIAELTQETGYSFEKLEFIGSHYHDPYEVRKRYCFLALGCKPFTKQVLDPTEFIEVIEIPLEEYYRMVLEGTSSIDNIVVLRALIHLGYLKSNFPTTTADVLWYIGFFILAELFPWFIESLLPLSYKEVFVKVFLSLSDRAELEEHLLFALEISQYSLVPHY